MIRALVLVLGLAATAEAQELKRLKPDPAPTLELDALDGARHSLADYRGKAVLVNFWATWCEPCREEMPSLERLRKSLEGRGFAVLAVNVGEGPAAARRFLEQMPLGFTILMDRDTRASRSWGARILPATFVVGPKGELRYSYYGALDWSREDVRAAIAALME